MYRKPYNINLEEFQEWIETYNALFTSDSSTHLRVYAKLNGNIRIEHKGKIVWQGIQPSEAVEKFNELSDELTNRRPS